jgi:hypothetical protein
MHAHARKSNPPGTGAGFGDFEIAGMMENNEETRQKPEAARQKRLAYQSDPGFKTTTAAATSYKYKYVGVVYQNEGRRACPRFAGRCSRSERALSRGAPRGRRKTTTWPT